MKTLGFYRFLLAVCIVPNKLGIIANDKEMKDTIERLYPEETKNGIFMVEILNEDEVEYQGQKLIAKGAKILVGRSGTYDKSIGRVSVPLLRLRVTASDILSALKKAAVYNEKIALILWEDIYLKESWLDLISLDVDIYTFDTGANILKVYEEAIKKHPDYVVVGGGIASTYARQNDQDYVFINASDASIKRTVNYANEMLGHMNYVNYQHELLSKTLDSVSDAVIGIDNAGIVVIFNKSAENILKISSKHILSKKLSEILPRLEFLEKELKSKVEKKDELLQLDSLAITYKTSLIWEKGCVSGILLSFQDITKLQVLEQSIRQKLNKKGLIAKYTLDAFVHTDESMISMLKKAEKIGKSDETVVIYGESGTGKELLAQSIHNVSGREKAPFVAINCAALSESILESELFGYEEGAFTGARKGGKPGVFELAHGGTIFLDEINSISPSLQGKLLRVIEEKEVMRLGSDYVLSLDVRVVSAANEDLKAMVSEKKFRGDLFYRLSTLEITIPPLRERKRDIKTIFIYFVRKLKKDDEIRMPTEEEKKKLEAYDWPGNVRELKNVAKRYVLFDEIDIKESRTESDVEILNDSVNLKEINQMIESRIISQLIKSGLTKNEIADKLGITRATLWNKISKM